MSNSANRSVIIVGAGAFGLSTALHLLEGGYKDVTIFDHQNYNESEYSAFQGADSASADTMKVIRSAYGSESAHTTLATEAIAKWKQWNTESETPLFVNCGWTRMHGSGTIAEAEIATLMTLEASGQGNSQYRITDSSERQRAIQNGWASEKCDPFNRLGRGFPVDGVLDTLAGFVYADAACLFALRKIQQLGAKIILDSVAGKFETFLYALTSDGQSGDTKRATGIRTSDGREHVSDIVIMAAGARTHELVPGLEKIVNTTGANIVHVNVPAELQARFRSEVFPVFSWNYTGYDEDGGLSGFPIDPNGTLKFLYRSPKWTNPTPPTFDSDTERITSKSKPWNYSSRTNVPKIVVDTVKDFISANIPELVGCDIKAAKICWDSFAIDLDFVIDWVPGIENCLVVTGGSGHGFKFLPTLGKYVVDVLEDCHNDFTKMWKWRQPPEEEICKFKDSMLDPKRRLDQQEMASISDLMIRQR